MIKITKQFFLLSAAALIILHSTPKNVFAASYDCKKASNLLEKTICGNDDLSVLDEQMSELYFKIRELDISPLIKDVILSNQRTWLKQRMYECTENQPKYSQCLKSLYTKRIGYLSAYVQTSQLKYQSKNEEKPQHLDDRQQRDIIDSTSLSIMNYSDLYENLTNKVVVVLASNNFENFLQSKSLTQGSGVAIAQNLIVTNCHVLEGNTAYIVIKNGKAYPAKINTGRFLSDACTIKLMNEKLPYFIEKVNIRPSQQIKIGESVIAIGSPRGLENTISTGIVSGIRHEESTTYIQTTAPISSGSSGGGLFDLSGNLIGITTMYYKNSQAINFAVAIEEFDIDN